MKNSLILIITFVVVIFSFALLAELGVEFLQNYVALNVEVNIEGITNVGY